ncbi:hypothetical protein C7S13_6171 [Burkholderia cepacia]|nr:hypothetical protein [Burkholderia cepacia]
MHGLGLGSRGSGAPLYARPAAARARARARRTTRRGRSPESTRR